MRKTALVSAGAAVGAVLIISSAQAASVSGWSAAADSAVWLAAAFALGAFAVMFAEYFAHGRSIHLIIGCAFLAVTILVSREALALRAGDHMRYAALPPYEWITLAASLLIAARSHRKSRTERRAGGAAAPALFALLWAFLVIYLANTVPTIVSSLSHGNTGTVLSAILGAVFLLFFPYLRRHSVHRGSAVIGCMAWGLLPAALAQAEWLPLAGGYFELLPGFASVMRLLAFAAPGMGMIAEHLKTQARLSAQNAEISTLLQMQQAVGSPGDASDMLSTVADLSSRLLGGNAVCIMPYDPGRGTLVTAAACGIDGEACARLTFRPSEGPPGIAFSRREKVEVADVLRDEHLSRKFAGAGLMRRGSALFVPLSVRDECLGVLGVFFTGSAGGPRRARDGWRAMDAVVGLAALALESARRLPPPAPTSGEQREMDIVWEIGQAVSSHLDLNELVDTLAEKLRGAVGAQACSVLLISPEADMKAAGNRRLVRYHSIDGHIDHCDQAAAAAARQGTALVMNNVPNSRQCRYSELVREDGGFHHLLCTPLSLPGFLGAICVFRQNTSPFGEIEKRLLTRLSPVVAAAVRNAELYDREKVFVRGLQSTFLPELPREIPGVRVSAAYMPAFDWSLIGGDFYGMLDMGEGRYAVFIGDASGHGAGAAVYAAMARYTIQALAEGGDGPKELVARLNATLCRYTPENTFVTLFYGVLDTSSGELTYVNAGNEYPMVYRAGGEVTSLENTGPAAGAVLQAGYEAREVSFRPGDVLFLYTDGASEARGESSFLGAEGLQGLLVEEIAARRDQIPQAVLARVLEFSEGRLRDDAAIVALEFRKSGTLF